MVLNKNKIKYSLASLTVTLICFSCTFNSPRRIVPIKKTGINGEVFYRYDSDQKLVDVFKEEYNNTGWWSITINDDTLSLHDEGYAEFTWPYKAACVISIDKPEQKRIQSDSAKFYFSYRPKARGEMEISGTMSYDTLVIPFLYKVFVE
jgi:hypothetical protein